MITMKNIVSCLKTVCVTGMIMFFFCVQYSSAIQIEPLDGLWSVENNYTNSGNDPVVGDKLAKLKPIKYKFG